MLTVWECQTRDIAKLTARLDATALVHQRIATLLSKVQYIEGE